MVKLVQPEWGTLTGEGPLSPAEIEDKARELLAQMTLREKVSQMSGDIPFLAGVIAMARAYNTEPIPAGENLRLGIPGIRFSDGPRGVVMYHSTCFPVSMARGASWDVELEERIGDAIGVEARAQGANFFGGVCINLLRHPAWGRAQETYGEDSYHLGEMGSALVRGVQRHIMACIKHYACNSIERARFKVNVKADERTLHEVYLPHFRRCVEQGAASVMSAYNKVNGEYCGHNQRLLTGILKEEWGFEGFVVSDFIFGVRDGKSAALAGLDIEMPFTQHYGRKLERLVRKGRVPEARIDAAVMRILRQKIRFSRVGEPGRYHKEVVAGPEHQALAREAAEQSAVLLKNDPVDGRPLLPLEASVRRIALLGRLAHVPNTGDGGSSMVRPPQVITPLQGLKHRKPELELACADGDDPETAARMAQTSDLAILVVGYTHTDEGEYVAPVPLVAKGKGGDRFSLRLSQGDEELILRTVAANPRTIVVMESGSAVITEAWRERVPAILMLWYPGMQGGHALANLLFGDVNPSGKLPCAFPRSDGQLPFFDPHADEIEYGLYHGYRLMDKQGETPAFAFGFGLSYTSFVLDRLEISQKVIGVDGSVQVRLRCRNTGQRAGAEVVQLYAGCQQSAYDRPLKELKGFQKIMLQAGEEREVIFELPARTLAVWDGGWVVEPGSYQVWIGTSSQPEDLLEARFQVV
jgi:beta-glucosidase